MYSLFNSEIRRSFVEQELTRDYLSFPSEIDEAYSVVINWLSGLEGMACFDRSGKVNLDSDELRHTGRQFSRFLPSHTLKVYQTLLHFESESITKRSTSLLEQPYILLVDDGCGGGTASVALISLVANYQKYRVANGLPIFPVTISCLGVDLNDNALKIYARFLGECASRVEPLMVSVKDIGIFPGTLPENAAPIIERVTGQDRTHCAVFALANIIRPLTRQHARTSERRSIFELLGIDKFLPSRWGKDIGAEEISTLSAVLSTGNIDQVVVLLVGAHGPERVASGASRRQWQNEMKAFQNAIHAKLAKPHQVTIDLVKQKRFAMVHPTDNFHRKVRGYEKSDEIEYDSGFVVINTKDHMEDVDWQAVLEPENLLLAWARVRNALSFETLEDTIEIRLFEANIKERLNKLRSEVLSYRWDALSIPEMLNFQVPKGSDKEPRPLSVCRLEDQILATAILQVKQQEYDAASHRRSYAYRLSTKRKGEQLYKGWWEQHPEFLDAAREVAKENPLYQVVQTDLSSYYTDIVQAELLGKVVRHLGLFDSRSRDLTENLINRDCGTHEDGCGIPQGHIMSGAVANLYLSEVDRLFEPGNEWGIEYFRYVDDMIFMFSPNLEADFVLNLLDQKLSELALRLIRSLEKTSIMSAQEFLELTARDTRLEELRKEHNYLLSDLYKLGRDYIRIGLDDWWAFVECYQRLLASIGAYIGVPWLSRQLQKNLRWWRKTFNWWHGLRMPEARQLEDLQGVDRWQAEFTRLNGGSMKGWIDRREKLVQGLSDVFQEGLSSLNADSSLERKRAGTYVTFAMFRLGQLGFGEKAGEVVDLIVEQPWVLRLRRVCQDLALQGREDLLLDALDRTHSRGEEEWGYVRATIFKALAYLPSVSKFTIEILRDAAFNGRTILERTMASEALFLLRRTEELQKDKLVNAIEQAEDAYLSKNYALLYAIAPGDAEVPKTDLSRARIVNEALEYARVSPNLDEIHRYEPEILREGFYEGKYPDDPEAFEDFPYGF